jgi:hypothetical protein
MHQLGVGQARFMERFHRGSVCAKPTACLSAPLKVFPRFALSHGISRQPDRSVGSLSREFTSPR